MLTQADNPRPLVVLASSFYTASLEQPFAQALARRNDNRSVVCVPYNQLPTFLLDARSLVPEETPATVILLLRIEDWIRLELAHRAANTESCVRTFRERMAQFLDILGRVSDLRLTLLVCPAGRGAYDVGFLGNAVRVAEYRSVAELRLQRRHCVVQWSDFESAFPALSVFNVAGDRLGHVPFSADGLDALAEFFVARLASLPVTILKSRTKGGENVALQEFLAGLEVDISVAPLTQHDEETAINLIRHTTHFINAPDRRWSAGDLTAQVANAEAGGVWTVRVRDRFGDHGLSGAMALSLDSATMRVGFWFLTCPVLGKQVEHALMNWMAQLAQRWQATTIEVPFVKGRDNQVLYEFLARLTHPEPVVAIPPLGAKETFLLSVSGLQELSLKNAPNPTAAGVILSTIHATDVPARTGV